ncbi:MAG: rhomboid family intramembrane serine protease [Actinomycetota bacterium]
MSLKYQTEEPQTDETSSEQTPNVERVAPVIPYYSIILIASLVAVAVFQILVDGKNPVVFGDESSMIAGFLKPAFLHGQYWRILTGATLHGGLMHLGFNCYALYVLGKLVETLSNRAHLAIVFLLSAIGGGILSLVFLPQGVSVGASGGIVGFLGYLAVYGYRRRELLTSSFLKNILFNIGFIALYGIMLRDSIDNFGHLGGLLTGAVYGFFQITADIYKDPRQAGKAAEICGLIALGIFLTTCLFSILLLLRIF